MFVFAEERERSKRLDSVSRLASILRPKSCALRPSRRPRSPSSNHNVKELLFSANFHSGREATPPARQARQAAWARCIGAQTRAVKRKKQNNFSACGWAEAPGFGRIFDRSEERSSVNLMWLLPAELQGIPAIWAHWMPCWAPAAP
jgi:hypothetical protein